MARLRIIKITHRLEFTSNAVKKVGIEYIPEKKNKARK